MAKSVGRPAVNRQVVSSSPALEAFVSARGVAQEFDSSSTAWTFRHSRISGIFWKVRKSESPKVHNKGHRFLQLRQLTIQIPRDIKDFSRRSKRRLFRPQISKFLDTRPPAARILGASCIYLYLPVSTCIYLQRRQ